MSLPSPLSRDFKDKLTQIIARKGGLLLCTDFDGTLVTFTGTPSETSLPEETRALLSELAALEKLHLAIISGRSFNELADLAPIGGATIAGNHGLKIRFEDGTNHELETGEKIHRAIAAMKQDLQEAAGGKEGIIIEDKSFGLALHYRKYEGNKEEIKKQFKQLWRKHSIAELEVLEGAELLEIRPGNWNKGDAVQLLQKKWGKLPTIYIGDDTTDEDAFEVLRGQELGIPIIVSQEEKVETAAQHKLNNPEEVGELLKNIIEILSSTRPS